MNKNLLQRLILIVTLGSIIYHSPVFSQYIPAPSIIVDNTKCYIISGESNEEYTCITYLDTPCYYDMIIRDSRNIKINCHFNSILVYNSKNVHIIGSGNVVLWNSSASCQITGSSTAFPGKFAYLYCLPIGVSAVIIADDIPLGALGNITVFLYTNRRLSNVLVTLESSCIAMIKPYYTDLLSEFIGPNVLFPLLKKGQVAIIRYYYVPQHGKNCTLSLVVKENVDRSLIQKIHKVNVSGESYIGSRVINSDESLHLLVITLLAIILFLAIL